MNIASLTLALPENVKLLIETGKWIVETVRNYRNAPALLQDWRKFGLDLCEGNLRLQIHLAAGFICETDDNKQRTTIESHLTVLQEITIDAKQELRKCIDIATGEVNRPYFVFSGHRKLLKILERFRHAIYDFTTYWIIVDISRRMASTSNLLTPSRLQTIHRYDGDYSLPVENSERLRTGAAEYKTSAGQIEQIGVLIERHTVSQLGRADIEDMVETLSRHLRIEPQTMGGVLECLGYRKEPHVEIIFKIPAGLEQPNLLRTLIQSELPRISRLKVAVEIAEGVALVQAAKLVHKSLRPDTILVFKDLSKSFLSVQYRAFLTDWSMMRNAENLSAYRGSESWMENIYRHPKRQGLRLDERYHMGHDIYSLGVILLEFGLAKSFIQHKADHFGFSGLYTATATQLSFLQKGMTVEAETKALTKPYNVHQIMLHLAEARLCDSMGVGYRDIVKTCLCAVENGIGGVPNFKDDAQSISRRFSLAVLQPLMCLHEEGGTMEKIGS